MDDILYQKLLDDIIAWASLDIVSSSSIFMYTKGKLESFNKENVKMINKEMCDSCNFIDFRAPISYYKHKMELEIYDYSIVRIHFCHNTIQKVELCLSPMSTHIIDITSNVKYRLFEIMDMTFNDFEFYNVQEIYNHIKTRLGTKSDELSKAETDFDKIIQLSSLQYIMDKINPNYENEQITIDI